MQVTDPPKDENGKAVHTGGPQDKSTAERSASVGAEETTTEAAFELHTGLAKGQWTTVYLAGEIHTAWRSEIIKAIVAKKLPIRFTYPVLDHGNSDDCGVRILGAEKKTQWHDHKGAKINAIRTRTLIGEADIVVARFNGESTYRQWNAAFEAGQAAALGKALIVMHDERSGHALKEVDAAALAVAETAQEVAQILTYVVSGELPQPAATG